MSTIGHIVVVDDEADIRETLREYLEIKGYRVSSADGGKALREIAERSQFDLVLLDINMPGEDGLSLARFLREQVDAGIIFLTAAGETVDRIVGLEIGADDYMAKPFDLRELHARIKAVLRRTDQSRAITAQPPVSSRVPIGTCMLDLEQHALFDADDKEVPITAMEFDLLRVFVEHPNKVLSRDRILDLAHDRDWDPYDRSIDIRIARLRRKIEVEPSSPTVIRTIRGAGYLFADGSDAE